MEKLFKLFAVLVIKWKRDHVYRTRFKLAVIYSGLTLLLLSVFSFVLYFLLLDEFTATIATQVANYSLQQQFIARAGEILIRKIFFIDLVASCVVLLLGYWLTTVTLRPLKDSQYRERRFVADAAHDIRTPLTVMKTEIEVFCRSRKDIPKEINELLKSTIEEIDGLTTLANNLLFLSAERKRVDDPQKNFLINPLLDGMHETLMLLAENKSQQYIRRSTLHNGVWILGDPQEIERMITNIVQNAVTYTDKGGSIFIDERTSKQNLYITIRDTGIGISPKDLPHVTKPFFRADIARSAKEGSGLGLAIAEEVATGHGGSLDIVSQLGWGTTVTIILPLT